MSGLSHRAPRASLGDAPSRARQREVVLEAARRYAAARRHRHRQQQRVHAPPWRALRRGVIDPAGLSQCLLELRGNPTKGRRLPQVFEELGLATPAQVRDLIADLKAEPPREFSPPPPESDPRLGKVIQRVLCDRRLLATELTATYMGRLPRDPQPVMLVLMAKEALHEGLWIDGLEALRATQKLDAPNLLPLLEVERDDAGFAMIYRFFPKGLLLASLLQRVGRLKLSEVLRITRELASGLKSLHDLGRYHRDVQPCHVVLRPDGRVFLFNTGLVFEPRGAEAFGARRTIYGSPHYIAPEACQGHPPNTASDIYSLGVLAFEMATGVRPFEGEEFEDLRAQHLEAPVPDVSAAYPELPKPVVDLFGWLMSKQPKDRPDATKLIGVLRSLEETIDRSGSTQRLEGHG